MYKNYEGYKDPTAGEAINKASRKKKKKTNHNWNRLTYILKEVPGFKQFVE